MPADHHLKPFLRYSMTRSATACCLVLAASLLCPSGAGFSWCAESAGAESAGAESAGAESTGAESAGAESTGAESASGLPSSAKAPAAARPKNRLADQTSPYLLQHVHNPVDWYPWGEEALAKARREKKLIFLSIGYSSCHWCHVMERESFTDDEIARFLNEHFVCIKVDREERPDVDAIYMAAVQAITGRGGWPLSVFLTPDAKPFLGGTYFPARDGDRPGVVGFLTVIQKVHDIWKTQPEQVQDTGDGVALFLQRELSLPVKTEPVALTVELAERAVAGLQQEFDPQFGGFGFDAAQPDLPKFPQPSNLFLLARVAGDEFDRMHMDEQQRQAARQMLITTLDHLAMGGIRDHLGGGFHRYTVDRDWSIPHFEKMLYDNGQLASVFAAGYALTGEPEYARVIDEMFQFLNRELSDDRGGFYAALDADSEHVEGKFYRWEPSQWQTVLGDEAARQFAAIYAASGRPNFEDHFYVPRLAKPFRELADEREVDQAALQAQIQPWRQQLLAMRAERERPGTDSKILTSWNGMMIRGLADAGRLLQQPKYTQRAEQAAEFVLAELQDDQGRLYRTYSAGQARLNAYLDDYACFVDGLIALHRATGAPRWLEHAERLTEKQIELFWDDQNGGFFFTSADHESLIVRGKQFMDQAVPSGNSVSVENLVYLAQTRDRPDYRDKAVRTAQAAGQLLDRLPYAAPRLVMVASTLGVELPAVKQVEPSETEPSSAAD